jgi:hypothetical protein
LGYWLVGREIALLSLGLLSVQGVEEVEVRAAGGGGVARQAVEASRYLPQPQLHQALYRCGSPVTLSNELRCHP